MSEPRDDEQYPPPWKRREVVGLATLYLGDCREIAPTLARPAAVISDPPYGIGEHGGRFRGRLGGGHRVLPNLGWDNERPPADAFRMMLDASETVVLWGGNYFADLLPPSKGWIYWDKLMGGDFSDGELAWTSVDRALRKITRCNKDHGKEHPTQKPTEVMAFSIDFARVPAGGVILDPYMGSGSTGVAAVQMRHPFVGIEIEESYFDIACRRIEQAQRQGDLLRDAVA
jgi:site-specific DNA-methyltransferase (adenine-specific)